MFEPSIDDKSKKATAQGGKASNDVSCKILEFDLVFKVAQSCKNFTQFRFQQDLSFNFGVDFDAFGDGANLDNGSDFVS